MNYCFSCNITPVHCINKQIPPYHPTFVKSYNNIASICYDMGDLTKAMPYVELASDIGQRSLPLDHPDLLLCKNIFETITISYQWFCLIENKY
jgi:hypothetical protein